LLHFEGRIATGKVDLEVGARRHPPVVTCEVDFKYFSNIYRMSRSFQNGPFGCNSVFGKKRESLNAGAHIINVKSRALFRSEYKASCDGNMPCSLKMLQEKKSESSCNGYGSYENLLNIRRGYVLDKNEINEVPPFNQMDLVSGLYGALDLNNVTTVCAGTAECAGVTGMNDVNCPPLYQYYRIDPEGELFGNTPCSINNYLNFVVLDESVR
jgi:hypothetical protein